QQKTQGNALPIGDVDVEFLHQSRRQKSAREAKARSRASKGPIAKGIRPRLGTVVPAGARFPNRCRRRTETKKRREDAYALRKLSRKGTSVFHRFRTKCLWSAMRPRIAF